jgi:hypothetical protein
MGAIGGGFRQSVYAVGHDGREIIHETVIDADR